MDFFFPDSQDQIDPTYDFERESSSPDRVRQRDDRYAHEVISPAPYRGILLSKALVVYKPIWQAPEELSRPEIDHIVPISGLGSHEVANLQVICRACNLAKGSGLLIDPDAEIRYAPAHASDVPRMHLFRLLQWLIARNEGRCAECLTDVGELTMRPLHGAASIARTTFRLSCYRCAALRN